MVKEAAAGRLHAPTPTTIAPVRHPSHSCGLLARFACLPACLPACLSWRLLGAPVFSPAPLLSLCFLTSRQCRYVFVLLLLRAPSHAFLLYLPSFQHCTGYTPQLVSCLCSTSHDNSYQPYPIRRHAPRATSSWRHTLLFKHITLLTRRDTLTDRTGYRSPGCIT